MVRRPSPDHARVIPPMPILVPAELDNWMQDLQQAPECHDVGDQRRGGQHKIGRRRLSDGLSDGRCGQVTVQAGRQMRTRISVRIARSSFGRGVQSWTTEQATTGFAVSDFAAFLGW